MRDDFKNPANLKKLADAIHMEPEAFSPRIRVFGLNGAARAK